MPPIPLKMAARPIPKEPPEFPFYVLVNSLAFSFPLILARSRIPFSMAQSIDRLRTFD